MFQTLRNAWKIEDLRKKLLFTLLILVIVRLGCAIPVPFLDPSRLQEMLDSTQGNLLGYLNLLTDLLLICKRLNVVGIDNVELNPGLDPSGRSTALACKFLREELLALRV